MRTDISQLEHYWLRYTKANRYGHYVASDTLQFDVYRSLEDKGLVRMKKVLATTCFYLVTATEDGLLLARFYEKS